jgi:hypothetical protein
MSSITTIGPKRDRQYRARWRTPHGASRSKTFTRKVDAERHLTDVEHSKLTASYVDPQLGRTTVADYWAVWSQRQPWRGSSRSSVTSLFTRHVLPAFGGRQLATIRRGDVESWAVGLPLAGRTARQAAQYLSTMLEAAVADGLIARNPAHGAKRPSVDAEPVVPFTDAEIDTLRAATPGWFDVALTLGLGAGLRQSEASGLTVDRIDWLRRTLTVDRQLVTPAVAGEPTFGPPKTKRSYRTVPLADAVVAELARHVEVHGTVGTGCCCIAPTGDRCAASTSATCGARCATGPDYRAPGSTTLATRTPRCSCPAGFRWPRPPSTSGIARRCC